MNQQKSLSINFIRDAYHKKTLLVNNVHFVMLTHQVNMRMYRKRARLTQEDVAFIASMPDYANVSRIETGLRQPDVEVLLVYHLLFDMPIQVYFESMVGTFKEGIIERIKSRIEALATEPKSEKMSHRVQFLQSLLSKLGISFQTL